MKQTDGWTDKNSDCVLQDFVSFGAAALLPFNQDTGTADHLMPLGGYFLF